MVDSPENDAQESEPAAEVSPPEQNGSVETSAPPPPTTVPATANGHVDDEGEVLLRVEDLHMQFGPKKVLHGVAFEVRRGEIFGFIGPNGAGKTTTIRILSTLSVPTRGDIWLDGIHVIAEPDEIRRRIGYMPDYVGVYPGLTVREYLDFFASAYRLRSKQRKSILDGVIELTDLGRMVETEVQVLSKGMRQRLCLAQTLIHDPELLILDEPASGLDPRARIEFRALLKELRSMGKTIFLSSHILTELSPICDSVGILEQGRLLEHGRVKTILDKLQGESKVYTVDLVHENDRIAETLREHPDVSEIALTEQRLRFRYSGDDENLHTVFSIFSREQVSFHGVSREQGDLETIFMQLTEGEVS